MKSHPGGGSPSIVAVPGLVNIVAARRLLSRRPGLGVGILLCINGAFLLVV